MRWASCLLVRSAGWALWLPALVTSVVGLVWVFVAMASVGPVPLLLLLLLLLLLSPVAMFL